MGSDGRGVTVQDHQVTEIIRINSQYQEVTAQEALKLTLAGDAVLVEHDAEWAYRYARFVIRGPWPPGEAALASEPFWAYRYAQDVIGGSWPQGEAAIASDPEWAYRYAQDMIGGPWPQGEAAIARDPYWARGYTQLLERAKNK